MPCPHPTCPLASAIPNPHPSTQPFLAWQPLLAWQVLDGAELDFSRYGDVLFEVAFAGARLTTGGNVATEGKKLDFNVRFVCCVLREGWARRWTSTSAA